MSDPTHEDPVSGPVASEPPSSPSSPSAEEIAEQLMLQATELWDYGRYYLAARKDGIKSGLRRRAMKLAMVGMVMLSLVAVLFVAGWNFVSGLSGGLAVLFGSPWLGRLSAGLLTVGMLVLLVYIAMKVQDAKATRKVRTKYEQWQNQQRSKFGEDVASSSSDGT